MQELRWPALVTLGIVGLLFLLSANAGRYRHKHRIAAPQTTGHPDFERAYRIQMNTIENAVIVLPVLWLFAMYLDAAWSAAIGAIWLVARFWYAIAYMDDPAKRGPPFGLAMLAFAALGIGSLWGIISQFPM